MRTPKNNRDSLDPQDPGVPDDGLNGGWGIDPASTCVVCSGRFVGLSQAKADRLGVRCGIGMSNVCSDACLTRWLEDNVHFMPLEALDQAFATRNGWTRTDGGWLKVGS